LAGRSQTNNRKGEYIMIRRTFLAMALSAVAAVLLTLPAFAAKYDVGATDKEIKVGHINPYSGPASAYGTIGRTIEAYIKSINEKGGVNGRQINFITYDDGYSPPKTMEQARRLVEQDQALFLFQTLGTPPNSAIHKYMNQKKVPQLFVATGATKWGDPQNFPWTMGWQPTYQTEGKIYARYILDNKPNGKIGILYQNDDYGKDYLKGFKDGLGAANSKLIVMEQSYEVADPTVDSQIVNLKNSGADVFFNITTPKFAAQAIKKAAEIGWKPLHFLNNVSGSIGAVLEPAGLANSQGLISTAYLMDAADPEWKNNPDMKTWLAWVAKYMPAGNINDSTIIYGYVVAQALIQVLKQCGDDLTRDNVMKQAASLKDFKPALLLPGISANTSPTDFYPIEQEQLVKFEGKTWVRFGKIYSAN
jgi:branched-chain amino acid transport system substrate-binding protein